MRVLHVTASYLPAVRYGGTIVSTHGLCKALAARGHDVHVFTTSVDGPHDSDVPHDAVVDVEGVKVRYFRSRHFRRMYYSPPLARALAREVGGFQLVHTHAVFVWPMSAAARAARRAGVPYVMSPRGMIEKELIELRSSFRKALWISFIERRNLEQAAALHVTSARELAELEKFGFNLPLAFEIPNGVDLEWDGRPVPLSPRLEDLLNGAPYILFLGRVSWKKGLDRLIRSLPFVTPDLRLVIAGNDEEGLVPALKSQAASLDLRDRVMFAGAVGRQEKLGLFCNARLMVLPSYSENFGNVVVEAMGAGCPVVVTPEVGVAPMVEATGAGWVVSGAAAVLGERLSALASDAVLRRQMGERGRAAATQELSWDRIAERMERSYRAVLRMES